MERFGKTHGDYTYFSSALLRADSGRWEPRLSIVARDRREQAFHGFLETFETEEDACDVADAYALRLISGDCDGLVI